MSALRSHAATAACGGIVLALLAGCGERIHDAGSPEPPAQEAARSPEPVAAPTQPSPPPPPSRSASASPAAQPKASDETGIAAAIRDARITANVSAGLSVDKHLKASNIRIDTASGVVTLHGSAPSEEARARALEIARHVDGVEQVSDQLEVGDGSAAPASDTAVAGAGAINSQGVAPLPSTASAGSTASDIEITMKVTTGMSVDRELGASKVEVTTREGVVTLNGSAPTQQAKERATKIAENVEHVHAVRNELKVMRPG